MAVPTTAWDETSPAGGQSRGLGDDRIREMKTQIREVIEVDHEMASSGNSVKTGYHNKVTFIEQSVSPSMAENTLMLFAKEVSGKTELFFDSYDSTGTEMQLTSNGNWVGGMVGEVRMWSGTIATIPAGWALCDGDSGRPELTNRFVKGIATDATEPGVNSGGSDNHYHAITHTHTIDHTHDTAHTHSFSGTAAAATGSGPYTGTGPGLTSASNHTHSITGTTTESPRAATGSPDTASTGPTDTANSGTTTTLPPYLELAFIVKV